MILSANTEQRPTLRHFWKNNEIDFQTFLQTANSEQRQFKTKSSERQKREITNHEQQYPPLSYVSLFLSVSLSLSFGYSSLYFTSAEIILRQVYLYGQQVDQKLLKSEIKFKTNIKTFLEKYLDFQTFPRTATATKIKTILEKYLNRF